MAVEIEEAAPTAASTMDVLTAIRTRRSIGKVRPERPPRAAIAAILEAATWAPNHRLTEPWRFVVLAGAARHRFGAAMAAVQAQGRPAPVDDAAAAEARAADAKTAAKALRAPVVIAVAVEPVAGPKVVAIEEVAAGAAAIQNMLLAAHALGLAAIWRTGGPSYDPAIKRFFGLAPDVHLLGFVYVGYPDGAPPERARTPAARLTRWLGWDDGADAADLEEGSSPFSTGGPAGAAMPEGS